MTSDLDIFVFEGNGKKIVTSAQIKVGELSLGKLAFTLSIKEFVAKWHYHIVKKIQISLILGLL